MTGHASRRFTLLAAGTFILGVSVLVLSATQMPLEWSTALLVLIVATLVAENAAVLLPRGAITSLSFAMSVAANVLLGPTSAGLIALCSGINLDDLRSRVSPLTLMFNIGQVVVAHVLAGWLYLAVGGRNLAVTGSYFSPISDADLPELLLPVALLALSALAVNALFVTLALSIMYATPVRDVWREQIAWVFPIQMSLAAVGVLMAQVMSIEIAGFALFVFPLLVSRQIYQRYTCLKQDYLDTVRSLVGALEAKDPYTRGHSERVAEYAAAMARSMGMSEQEVERIRLAAQLHDLGKVGLSDTILGKRGSLTSDEYYEVRNHPEIAAGIVERITTLSHLASIIRHHHEKYDGTGYVSGLKGDQIPLESRVLAVADSFDAMTSSRAYRAAMSSDEAADEIIACQGSQFDPQIVVHLAAIVDVAHEMRRTE